MRPWNILRTVASLTVALGTTLPGWHLLHAGEKSGPVPDWALKASQVPTPESAKDAPAVVLNDERFLTIDSQNHAVEREHYTLRILKPQGRSYAHCAAYYDTDSKLHFFHAWTITSAGKQFQARDEDFTDHGIAPAPVLQLSARVRIATPLAADPGSVIACETEVQLRPYMTEETWNIQSTIPILSESLSLFLPPGGHYADSWSNHAPIQPSEIASDYLRWELHDMPALDLEDLSSTPSWSALSARMSLFWGSMAVSGTSAQWRAIGQWTTSLEEHRSDPTPEITSQAQQLIAGAPDLYTKLQRITQYIQKNIRYFDVETRIGGLQAHPAADIYRNHYGDCKDKTILLISMLQSIGIHAYYLHVDTNRGILNPAAPSLIGNHVITAIELPSTENDPRLPARIQTPQGKTLLIFDPTDEWTPIGLLRAQLQGAYGNLADGENSQLLLLPILPPSVEGSARSGQFLLSADGTLTGDLHEHHTGDDASSWRQFLASVDAQRLRDSIEHRLEADLPGLAFKDFTFASIPDLEKPLDLTIPISAANYAHPSGSLLILRPHILGTQAHIIPDVMEGHKRPYPIVLGYPGIWRDSYNITLPAGYTVDDIPSPVNMDTPFASYRSSVTAQGNLLHYESEYTLRTVEIPPTEAANFRKLESAILSSEKASVILKKQ